MRALSWIPDLMRSLCCLTLICLSSSAGAASLSHFGIEMAAAGDLNEDGHQDLLSVVAVDSNELGLFAIDGVTGQKLWFATSFTNDYWAYEFTPVTAIPSIDDDKINDIVLGIGKEGIVFFLSGKDGTLIDKLEGPSGRFGSSLLALSRDLDGDGIDDLLIGAPAVHGAFCPSSGQTSGHVFAISTGTRQLLWQRDAPPGGSNFGWAMTELRVDYDGDHKPDVLVSDNCRANPNTQGAVYVLSSATGQILQTVANPTVQPNGKNILFGYSLASAPDLDQDHFGDYFVGAPNIYGEPGISAVDLISGATGELICHYVSPTGDPLDGFGAWLAGGNIKLAIPYNACYGGQDPYWVRHDLLVGAPDYPSASSVGRAYLLRIHKGACEAAPLLTLDNSVPGSAFGNRVAIIDPPWAPWCQAPGGFSDLLVNSDDDPNTGEGNDGRGSIRRYSGEDGSFKQAYVTP